MSDDGDDLLKRRSHVPDLLRYQERADTRTMRQTRSKGGKVTTNTVRNNVVQRVDVGAEIMCIRILATQLTRGEFECWIALKEGIMFRPVMPKYSRAIVHRTWFSVPPPAKSATLEQVSRHYGYTEGSIKRMDQAARKLLTQIRERAGLVGDDIRIPVWPVVNSDENLLAYLYGLKG